MKYAIATDLPDGTAMIDPHFGRCACFCIYDSESREMTFIDNPGRNQKDNAGHEAAMLLISIQVNCVIAGRFGIKVADVFRRGKIHMIIPESQKSINEMISQINY